MGAPLKQKNTRACVLTDRDLNDGKDDEDEQLRPEGWMDDAKLPDGWSTGGPCHQAGVGAPLQQINTRARVLTDSKDEEDERTPEGWNVSDEVVEKSPRIEENAKPRSVMMARHTPLLMRNHDEGSADMKKLSENHGSPIFKNHSSMIMDKSPSVINNRIEQFGDISQMISQWGRQEEKEEKVTEGIRKRKSSQKFKDLCRLFEEEKEGTDSQPHTSQPDSGGRGVPEGGGEGVESSHTIGLKSVKRAEGVFISPAAKVKPAAAIIPRIILTNNCATAPANERQVSRKWTNRKAELIRRKHEKSILQIPGVNDQ